MDGVVGVSKVPREENAPHNHAQNCMQHKIGIIARDKHFEAMTTYTSLEIHLTRLGRAPLLIGCCK